MRLLIISHVRVRTCAGAYYVHGGFGRFADALATRFSQVRLLTCCIRVDSPPDEYRLRSTNISVAPLPDFATDGRLRRYTSMLLAAAMAMVKLPWELRSADLVHPRLPSVVGAAAAAVARISRRPVFFYVAGDWESALKSRGDGPASRVLAILVGGALRGLVSGKLCFTAGEAVARRFGGPGINVVPIMTTVIDRQHVVTMEAAAEQAQRNPREILFVGSIWEMKGVHILLKALALLKERGIVARLRVIGRSNDGGQWFTQQVREAGVEALVSHQPHMDWERLIQEYSRSNVFVMPSLGGRGEGVPKVVLEAMARGVPVVATDVGGVSSLVVNNVNGLMVPPGSAAAIADAVERLWHDVNLRRQLATQAVATAESFGLEAAVEQMMGRIIAQVPDLPAASALCPSDR